MLTTHANNHIETANNATNSLLATNTPGYTGGMLAAEQAGGRLAAGVGSRARTSLIDRMTAEAQVARASFAAGITFRDEQGKVTKVALTADRVEEALDRVRVRIYGRTK